MGIIAYLRALTELGPKYVAVTDGARGAFVASHKEIVFSPALESKIVGTAGAGDAFGATLTAYLALGYRLAEAVCAATANSASVVGHVDTQTGLLRRHELDQKVAAGQRAIRSWPL
jgi:ribokinase